MGMRERRWKAATKPAAFSAIAGLVIAGSVLYPGMDTAELELHDAGVWVTQNDGGYVGHLNHESNLLDGGLRAPFDAYDLHQQDENVAMVDSASGALVMVDGAQITPCLRHGRSVLGNPLATSPIHLQTVRMV